MLNTSDFGGLVDLLVVLGDSKGTGLNSFLSGAGDGVLLFGLHIGWGGNGGGGGGDLISDTPLTLGTSATPLVRGLSSDLFAPGDQIPIINKNSSVNICLVLK